MSGRTSSFLLFGAVAVLTGCAATTPPSPADYAAEAMPALVTPPQWSAGETAGVVGGGWLGTFADDRLDALVREAITNNPDLRVAATQVQVASEYARLADATLWPQVNLLARGGGDMGGDSSGLQGVGIFADWEIDVWGRIRAGRSAARAGSEAVALDAAFARQSVAALTAKSYFVAVEARLQQQLALESHEAARKLAELAEQRERVGSGNGYDSALARANVATLGDTVEQLRLAHEQALRALEALLGRYPAADIEVDAGLARLSGPVPAGLPSELLERRPDVVAAERRVAAAFHREQEAKTARLPRISLTVSVSDISSELFVLKDRENPTWSGGASLLAPIFNGGALQQQVVIRTAEQKQAVAEYGRVGARAFGEVEGALASEFAAKRREQALVRAVAENQRALELAQVRYRVGSGDLRSVQQQQLAVYGANSSLLRVQTEQLVQRVNVYLALGGGFDATPVAPMAPAQALTTNR